MIGRILNDRFRIDRRIGKGAFGEVFRAHDVTLKRDVAIKLLKSPGHDDGFKKRFLRESESMAKLLHPNIVTVFDFGEYNELPFLVMELVDGISLLEVIETQTPDVNDILGFGVQISRALQIAHDQEIVHRDLTLKNIMLNRDGHIKVLDFGLVKLLNAEIQSDPGLVVGTPTYLSPEQARGEPVDGRADIFSFGVCLYRMLCGRFPFEAEHPAAILYLITNTEPRQMETTLPLEVRDAVLKCLEKQREDRFENFAEVETLLSHLRTQQDSSGAISSISGAIAGQEQRSSKRNPYLNRVMIESPKDFFGRGREVKRIYSRLDAPHPQSISIVGERRVGKSSLLNYIYQRRNRRDHMQHYRNAIFVYMDFQRGEAIDVGKFIDMLFEMFNYEQKSGFGQGGGKLTLDDLKDAVEKLNNDGKRIIVLMDEFESITTNPNFEMQFFSFLRFLANNYKVAYVTSSLNDLQQMCYDKEIADSPFFNIFSNLPLRPFTRDEALELVRVPSAREGLPLEQHSEHILDMSGYFPLYIQIACSAVFESVLENDGGEPDWEQVHKTFADEAIPHYSFVWDRMDDTVRGNLTRVASGKQIGKKFRHVSEDLHRLGYLMKKSDDDSMIFSDPFRQFVLDRSQAQSPKRSLFGSLFNRGDKRR